MNDTAPKHSDLGVVFTHSQNEGRTELPTTHDDHITAQSADSKESHLSSQTRVFDVSKAIESTHGELGTIVSDKQRRRPTLGQNLRDAFNEWWGKTRSGIEKKVKLIEPLIVEHGPTVTSATARKEIIQEAAQRAAIAPRDDSRVVIEQFHTLKGDIARTQGVSTITIKEVPKTQEPKTTKSSWVHLLREEKKSNPPEQGKMPDMRGTMIAPDVNKKIPKRIDEYLPDELKKQLEQPLKKPTPPIVENEAPAVSQTPPAPSPAHTPVSIPTPPVVTHAPVTETPLTRPPVPPPSRPVVPPPPVVTPPPRVVPPAPVPVPKPVVNTVPQEVRSQQEPVTSPALFTTTQPSRMTTISVEQKQPTPPLTPPVVTHAPVTETPLTRPPVPPPSRPVVPPPPVVTPPPRVVPPAPVPVPKPVVNTVPQEANSASVPTIEKTPPVQPREEVAKIKPTFHTPETSATDVKKMLRVENDEQPRISRPVTSPETLQKIRVAQALVTGGIVLLLLVGYGVYTLITHLTADTPISASPEPLFVAERVIPIPFTGDTTSFAESFKTSIAEVGPRTIAIEPTWTQDEVPVPLTSETFLETFKMGAPSAFRKILDPSFMLGAIVTSRPEPFLIVRSYQFDGLFAGMLAWEPTLAYDLGQLFGLPDIPDASFTDAVRNNNSTRILRDEIGNEVLLYSFVNQNTVIITTSGEALSALIEQF